MTDQPNVPTPDVPTPPKELSPNLQRLSQAIRQHGTPRVVFAGFDLYIELMGSGHLSMADFLMGGALAKGDEPEGTLKIPMLVLGGRIVLSMDPTIQPEEFYLK